MNGPVPCNVETRPAATTDVFVGRQDDFVNDVNHAVAGSDVGGRDVGHPIAAIGDLQATGRLDLEYATLDGGDRFAHRYAGGRNLGGHHVVGQHGGQQGLVGEQRGLGDAQFRQQGGEGVVGRCEDCERPGALQRFHQSGRYDGFDQDTELRVAQGDPNDVGGRRGIIAAAAGSQRGGRGGGKGQLQELAFGHRAHGGSPGCARLRDGPAGVAKARY